MLLDERDGLFLVCLQPVLPLRGALEAAAGRPRDAPKCMSQTAQRQCAAVYGESCAFDGTGRASRLVPSEALLPSIVKDRTQRSGLPLLMHCPEGLWLQSPRHVWGAPAMATHAGISSGDSGISRFEVGAIATASCWESDSRRGA